MTWQKTSGNNRRSKVEAAIGRYKRVIGCGGFRPLTMAVVMSGASQGRRRRE
jgi:hypothetical protein